MHQPPNQASRGLTVAGYITAIIIPIVGFFVGLALILKNRAGHGIAVMVLSVLIPVMAFAVAFRSDDDQFEFTAPSVSATSTPTVSEADVEKSWDAYYRCLAVHNNRGEDYRTQLNECVHLSP